MDVSTRVEGPRPFRSRRDRPCDACRGRKIACRIDSAPPCAFCAGRGSACTFEHGPSNKRRKVLPSDASPNGHRSHFDGFTSFAHTWEDFASEPFDSTIFDTLELEEDESPISPDQLATSLTHSDGRPTSTSPQQSRMQSLHAFPGSPPLLDTTTLHHSQVPPDSGHLTRHVTLPLMAGRDQLEVTHVRLQRTRRLNEPNATDEAAPILIQKEHPPFLLSGSIPTPRIAWQDVESLLSERQRHELVQLFFNFVQPAFPVLHRAINADHDHRQENTFSASSIALSSCVYATALPFSIHNDYLNATLTDANGKRDQLYSMSVAAILQEINSPTVETLQACLLLLQKGPTVQHRGLTPTYPCLTSLAVTIAKSLGLQYECSTWSIDLAEKHFRQRLWWAIYTMDIWISIDTPGGRSIRNDEYDVQLPVAFGGANNGGLVDGEHPHFNCLVDLSHLLSQICDTYYTVRAAKETTSDLFKSLELAKPLRSTLNECKQNLKIAIPLDGNSEPGASGSVHLAGCVTSIILFRALLRPLQAEPSPTLSSGASYQSAATAIMTGSINSAREAVELLETMVSMIGPWSEFWHSWSQGNFAIVSTFLVQLSLMSHFDEKSEAEVAALISRWKRAIRVGAGSGGWGSSLMSMALTVLDSLLNHTAD